MAGDLPRARGWRGSWRYEREEKSVVLGEGVEERATEAIGEKRDETVDATKNATLGERGGGGVRGSLSWDRGTSRSWKMCTLRGGR